MRESNGGARRREIVVVTGASAGIGRATVRAFARAGADVACLARGTDGLDGAKRDVEAFGGRALTLPVDVADAAQVERAAQHVEDELGPIDVWVNNAMTSVFSPFMEITPEEFLRVTEVTYLGQVYGTRSALKRMLPRNQGSIVLVGSALAYRGIPLQSAYCGAKHAIQGFFDSVRAELLHAKSRVHISMVQLPGVNTPQFEWSRSKLPRTPRPLGRVFQPEVAADAIMWAAHHRRREVYVGGPTIEAIWANKVAPSVLDRYLAAKGYAGQQTDVEAPPDRRDNLFSPVEGDHGAHGQFDDEAKSRSFELWASQNRTVIGATVAGLVAASALALVGQRRLRSFGLFERIAERFF